MQLAETGQPLFHLQDLATLFGMKNENTLRVMLHRWVRAGMLHRIQRGLYSIIPPEKIDPVLLGGACLHRYCYLSTESILHDEGLILQSMDVHTFVSGVSRRFAREGHHFVSRRLHARFLHNQRGIRMEGGILRASLERAIADLLYFNPWYHFDCPVDWEKVRAIQQAIGYPLTPHRYAHSERF